MSYAIVLAGGVPRSQDLLYEVTQGRPKALVDIAGRPMVQWVLAALDGVERVSEIIVVGLDERSGLTSTKPLSYLPSRGGLVDNVLAGVEFVQQRDPDAHQVLTVSADIPLLSAEMVDHLLDRTTDPTTELYFSVISRQRMEQGFPTSHRTYAHLVEGDLTAGDAHVIRPHIVEAHRGLWDALTASRKHVMQQALRLGPGLLVQYALGRLSVAKLERRMEEKFGLRARAVEVDYPEMGMDVDKPFQLEICRRLLSP